MALPNVGGGQQLTDGNLNEIVIGAMPFPNTSLTATATLTVAQLVSQWAVTNPSTTAATYTLPTVAVLEAGTTSPTVASPVNNAKPGSTFDLIIVNIGTSSGAVTIATAAGWTLVGNMTVAITSQGTFRAQKTAGGPGINSAWSLTRIA